MAERDIKSLFATHSWEPRFVVEHYDTKVLQAAIDLWTTYSYNGRGDIKRVARYDNCLLIGHPGRDDDNPGEPWETLGEPIAIASLAEWIRTWLDTATYPKMPSFDGCEGAGFTIFGNYYRCVEVPRGHDSAVIVVPKWIEIHK